MGMILQGPEWFETIQVPNAAGVQTPQELLPQKELRKNKFIWGIKAVAKFHVRVVGAAGNASVFNKEFPLGFIDRLKVDGSSKKFGGVREFQNVSAPTLVQFLNGFTFRPLSAFVAINGGKFIQMIGPTAGTGIDGSTNNALPAGPTAGASTTDYDCIVAYMIPFVPLGVPIEQQALFMLKGPDWEVLNVHFYVADQSGLFDVKANTTITFGAIEGGAINGGSSAPAGNPTISIHLMRPNLGTARDSSALGRLLLHRTFQPLTSTIQAANLTDGLIARLSVTMKYLRMWAKTGVKPTDTPSNGVGAVIQGLTDGIITRPKLKKAGVLIRNPIATFEAKEWYSFAHGTPTPAGYILYDFCESGDVNTYFPADQIKTKDDFTFEGDVTAAANQIGEILEERILEAPGTASVLK